MQLYRVLRDAAGSEWDFLSHAARGVRSRTALSALEAEEWAGISVYDSVAAARMAARTFSLGNHLALLDIPVDGTIGIAQALHRRHHYTLWADVPHLQRCIHSIEPL